MTAGMDRRTGRLLTGWPHVEQSIEVIISTFPGSRVMRRAFGFVGPGLLGRNLTQPTVMAFCTALAIVLLRWEPRFRPRYFGVDGARTTIDGAREGKIGLTIQGDYIPGALEGDFSVVTPKTISL